MDVKREFCYVMDAIDATEARGDEYLTEEETARFWGLVDYEYRNDPGGRADFMDAMNREYHAYMDGRDFTSPIAREAAAANGTTMQLRAKTGSRAEAATLRRAAYQAQNAAPAPGRLIDILEAEDFRW